jgi:hypothetical protein
MYSLLTLITFRVKNVISICTTEIICRCIWPIVIGLRPSTHLHFKFNHNQHLYNEDHIYLHTNNAFFFTQPSATFCWLKRNIYNLIYFRRQVAAHVTWLAKRGLLLYLLERFICLLFSLGWRRDLVNCGNKCPPWSRVTIQYPRIYNSRLSFWNHSGTNPLNFSVSRLVIVSYGQKTGSFLLLVYYSGVQRIKKRSEGDAFLV